MLINFTVGNYRSFRKKATLSMEATSIKELKDSIIQKGKYKLLPSAVIYGANSSGKSNLLTALLTMKRVLLDSVKLNPADELNFDPFALFDEEEQQPIFFEIEFLIDTLKYRYGYSYVSTRIISEWLYEKREKEREYKLFYRLDGDMDISEKLFKEGIGKDESTPANRLFLSLVVQLNGEKSKRVLEWFQHCNYVSGINSDGYEGFTMKMLYEHLEGSKEALAFFKKLNLGFEEITFKEVDIEEDTLPSFLSNAMKEKLKEQIVGKKMLSIKTKHRIFDEKGETKGYKEFSEGKMESEGTKKIIQLSGPIFDTLLTGKVLLVDELEAKLHPLLMHQIIQLFNNPKMNKKGAQLIFVTHNTNLLNIKFFRRDQIWFVEKDAIDETELYSLVEFKDVKNKKIRNDSSLEKNLLVSAKSQ